MIEISAASVGPAAGYLLYFLFRALKRPPGAARSAPDHHAAARSILTGEPGRTDPGVAGHAQLAWPITAGLNLVVPVERWSNKRELLAWRFWGLGRHADGGVRLTSFRAPWAWDGPVLRAHRFPSESPFSASGVHALKAEPPRDADVHWSDECWVSGWVALSGRVVEHEHGYRAERAVIRRLRLGVGTHLRMPRIEDVLALSQELERRYQAPVNLGHVERRFAARVLVGQEHLGHWGIPKIALGVRAG